MTQIFLLKYLMKHGAMSYCHMAYSFKLVYMQYIVVVKFDMSVNWPVFDILFFYSQSVTIDIKIIEDIWTLYPSRIP